MTRSETLSFWLVAVVFPLVAGAREIVPLNDGWRGEMRTEEGVHRVVESLNLPHNWDDYHGFRHTYHGNQHGTSTYHKTFVADPRMDVRSFLVFDGAGSFLTVQLNGKTLCTHRPAGRLVTTLEVTDALVSGANELVVSCDHPSEMKDFPWVCGGCSGCVCEGPEPFGLFRSVRLEMTAAARIAPFGVHVWHDRNLSQVYVETEIDWGRCLPKGYSLRVVADELGFDKSISLQDKSSQRLAFALGAVSRWSPENPKLYGFRVDLVSPDGEVCDTETVRTGFRTIHWPILCGKSKEHRFVLNGSPTLIHGTAETDHRFGGGLAFEPEEIDARCAEFKKLGFNAFREGHEPHDLRYMRRLEELGLLWYAGFSTHLYFDTLAFRTNFLTAVEQWVKERRNSPALVIWGLQNESRLPPEFAREATELIHRLDPMSGGEDGRPVVTCNWGEGTDWNVVQNWSGTYVGYGRKLMNYQDELARDDQLLNGEYGAWRLSGYHSDPDAPWDVNGPWTEEHQARILGEKLIRAWKARDRVCGQFLWTFFSHENPGRNTVDEGYRLIDKIGPINHKGLYTLWGRRVEAWYLYLAYGKYLNEGRLSEVCDHPLSWWLREGRRLAEPPTAEPLTLEPRHGATYLHRLNCGDDRFVDSYGNVWEGDDTRFSRSWAMDEDLQIKDYAFIPVLGSQDTVEGPIKNVSTENQGLFSSFRYGRTRLAFEFPVPTNADCVVEVFYVEPGSYGRCFDVALNGKVVDAKFSPSRFVPERNAVRRVYVTKATTDGKILLSFPRVQCNQAVVSAIAISTDAQTAARQVKDERPAGYPQSDGLSWKELSAMVRHKTYKHLIPLGKEDNGRTAYAPQALPIPDKDGFHRAWFAFYVAGDYSASFKVLRGNPVGKKISWRFTNEDCDQEIAAGDFTIDKVPAGGMVKVPLRAFVNAGVYTYWYRIEDDSVSVRQMLQ